MRGRKIEVNDDIKIWKKTSIKVLLDYKNDDYLLIYKILLGYLL